MDAGEEESHGEETDLDLNPGARLLDLLTKVHSSPAEQSLKDAWSNALGTDSGPRFYRLYAIAVELPGKTEEAVEALEVDERTRSLLLAPLEPIRATLAMWLHETVQSFRQNLGEATLPRLELTADRLRVAAVGLPITSDQVERWYSEVLTLLEEVHAAELPAEVKALLVRLLRSLEVALSDIQILGLDGMRDAAESVVGGLVLHHTEVPDTPTGKDLGKRLGRIVAGMLLAMRLVGAAAELPADVGKLLELGAGPVLEAPASSAPPGSKEP